MKRISTRRYEDQIKEVLKNKGFNDSQIFCLTKGYTKYESEHEFERIENFSSVLELLMSGVKPSTEDMKEKFFALKEYIQSRNITLEQAMSLHFYTEGQYEILKLKREQTTPKDLVDNAEEKLFEDLRNIKGEPLSQKEITAAEGVIGRIKKDLSKNVFSTFDWINNVGLGSFAHCFSFFAYQCSEIVKAYKIIPFMDKVLKNQLMGNTILYRGISRNYLENYFETKDLRTVVGKKLEDKGYSSTSLLFNGCNGYQSPLFVTLKLYVPKGTEGLDVTNFSTFDTENEILLNSNEVYIMNYREYAPNCIMLTGFVLSKNLECYKDIGLPPQNLNSEENE